MSTYANKGKGLESTILCTNEIYDKRGIAFIQRIATPVTVRWNNGKIDGAFHREKSTLDFRGTLAGGQAISFDCKESTELTGLPLSYIKPHQVEYMRKAAKFDEITFLVVYIKPLNKYFVTSYHVINLFWETWQQNRGKRGYNFIPIDNMTEVTQGRNTPLDYLAGLQGV